MRLIEGFRLGHWTNPEACTGCTVLLCPPDTVASGEIRGSSPGTRECALLSPEKKLESIDALLLTGGSAFGLSAADGVVRWLEEHGLGYETPWGRVPIVPAAVIFDLNVGSRHVRPDSHSGYEACESASPEVGVQGNIGAGYGATVGKWAGIDGRMKGGFGCAAMNLDSCTLQVIAVVNAVGDVLDERGDILAGARSPDGRFAASEDRVRKFERAAILDRTNTTLVVLLTDALLSKTACFRVSQRLHDGLARSIAPVHTSYDGDASFVLSRGNVQTDIDAVAEAGTVLVAEAVRNAVRAAAAVGTIPGLASR